jgi:GntR family transcriptional repressor for pyruvate dehydrogenase complex
MKSSFETIRPTENTTETLAAIGPVARSSVVDAVADRLRGEILAGRLAAGSRLPSERELSLALGVNRLTLRAALARLEALGLVSTRHGAGTVVASWRERAGLDALAVLIGSLSPSDAAWHELVTSMLEVRRVLAAEAIALAALRHTEDDLDQMRAIAGEQRTRVGDALSFARGDIAFQRAVVRAARNVGLELVLNTFARFPDEQPELLALLYDKREDSLELYDAVIEMIRSGDSNAAREIARGAFERIDAQWVNRQSRAAASKKNETSPQRTDRDRREKPARAPATSKRKKP